MREKYLVILVIILLVFTGCEDGDSGTVSTSDPYLGGQDGIQMKFLEGLPPDYVFDNGGYGFGIAIQLENVGESSVDPNNAQVEIIGINPKDFNLNSQDDLRKNIDGELVGAKKNFNGDKLPGGLTVVEFSDLNYMIDLPGNTGLKLRAELCYQYTTFTSTKLCIKRNVLENLNNQKICELSGEKNPQNSGGPVHITSMKETPMGQDKIQLAFIIKNVKPVPGIIFKSGTGCDDRINNPDINKVYLDFITDIDGVRPVCQGFAEGHRGEVTLYGGEPRIVTCTLDISGVDSIFEKVFQVNLEYNYLQYIERPLEIRDVSTAPN
ncbi:MAG: hypothetical protein KKF44_00985 [Nanoarchaeota archaeon]|nr:hypothetical protein [Nanoarchaeota archaeon]